METDRVKRAFAITDLYDLFLRPRRFATQVDDATDNTYWTLFFAWLVGVSSTVERVDARVAQSEVAGRSVPFLSLEWIGNSWLNYWILICIGGVISGVFFWYLAGWWYQVRLRFSGAKDVSSIAARSLPTWQFTVVAIPAMMAVVFDTFTESSYLTARRSVTPLSYLLVIPVFWSIWVNYSMATASHHLVKWRAVAWFVALPAVYYLFALGLFAMLFAGWISP